MKYERNTFQKRKNYGKLIALFTGIDSRNGIFNPAKNYCNTRTA